jgi:hypothetical protein
MTTAPFDVEAAIKRLGETEAEQAFATISVANRMARKLPPPQPGASLAGLYKWYSDPNTKASEKVAPIPDDLALRLSNAVLRLAAQEPQLVPTLTEAIAEQAEEEERAAVRETLGRAVAVSLILLVATTAIDAHGANWVIQHNAMSDDVLRALVDGLATLIGVAGK